MFDLRASVSCIRDVDNSSGSQPSYPQRVAVLSRTPILPTMDAAIWGFIGVVVGGTITGLVSIKLEALRDCSANRWPYSGTRE